MIRKSNVPCGMLFQPMCRTIVFTWRIRIELLTLSNGIQ